MGMRHFDVQLIGGMVLHGGHDRRDEDRRGQDAHRHARRRPQRAGRQGRARRHGQRLPRPPRRRVDEPDLRRRSGVDGRRPAEHAALRGEAGAYACDVTYGTNSEFGFDYLRDNMASRWRRRSSTAGARRGRAAAGHARFAIVDEVDNILIDEARTPLIISGAPEQAADLYVQFAKLAPQMEPGKTPEGMDPRAKKEFVADFDFEFDEKHKTVAVTEQGVAKAERFLGIDHLYRAENGHLVNHLIQSLKAESLYKRDVDYAVIDGEVKIIDEFTGRILEGRRWSEGLHQAVEAKEGVRVQEENQTLATITLPELLPHVRQARRHDRHGAHRGDRVHEDLQARRRRRSRRTGRWSATTATTRSTRPRTASGTRSCSEIAARHETGQPVLVGTISVEVSELLAERLQARGIAHTVLNAKPEHAEREGEIVAEAGQPGAVTIATNMAGRGVDIKLGGNPEHLDRSSSWPSSACSPATPTTTSASPRSCRRSRSASRSDREKVHGGRRPVHLRHRAPRVAPDRQPAARPLRPPGRPGRVALLPLRRGRPRAPVRRRPHLQDPRPPRRPSTRRATRSRSRPGCSPSRSRRRRRRSRSRTS